MTLPITEILDDGLLVTDMLRSLGINTTDELEKRAADVKGRRQLARQILDWVTAADLTRIKGVGRCYARLLQECEVRTTRELSYRSPQNLTRELQEANDRLRLADRPPPEKFVTRWIEQAKTLELKVTYR
jgi:predicted flap endonuclease-1-like 5' DNA nuclease